MTWPRPTPCFFVLIFSHSEYKIGPCFFAKGNRPCFFAQGNRGGKGGKGSKCMFIFLFIYSILFYSILFYYLQLFLRALPDSNRRLYFNLNTIFLSRLPFLSFSLFILLVTLSFNLFYLIITFAFDCCLSCLSGLCCISGLQLRAKVFLNFVQIRITTILSFPWPNPTHKQG